MLKLFCLDIFDQLDFTKTIIMASESMAIDSEPIRARGVIVNYYMVTIVRALLLVAERARFSCDDPALLASV